MATLVHINGPTAVGKSSIAERLVETRPLALCLDIDELRMRLGRWGDRPESKQIARELGFAMARAHLEAGHDVVVPQLVVRSEVVDRMEALADGADASFVEVILVALPEELVARARRSRVSEERQHPRDLFTLEELAEQMNHTLEALGTIAAARAAAHVVDVSGMSPHQAVGAVAAVLR